MFSIMQRRSCPEATHPDQKSYRSLLQGKSKLEMQCYKVLKNKADRTYC